MTEEKQSLPQLVIIDGEKVAFLSNEKYQDSRA